MGTGHLAAVGWGPESPGWVSIQRWSLLEGKGSEEKRALE